MAQTYRTLRGVMSYVDVKDDIPDWAADYAVGDDIAFRNPKTAELETEPVAGFSTRDEYRGCPAIIIPDRLRSLFADAVGIGIITEDVHVPRAAAQRVAGGATDDS